MTPPTSSPASSAGNPVPRRLVEQLGTEHHTFSRPPTQASEVPPASVQTAAKPMSETNSAYMTVDLPSKFQFYQFKTLTVRPLKAGDQAKLHQAAVQNSIRQTVEAISATLGDGVSALDLSPQDFYYLMYWQRTQSFLRTPMVVTSYCSDPDHNSWVIEGKPAPTEDDPNRTVPVDEATLKLTTHVSRTTLEVIDLDLSKSVLPESLTYGQDQEKLGVYIETMRDVVFAAEHIKELGEDLATSEWLAGYAAFLLPKQVVTSGVERPENLKERMARVEEFSPDLLADLDDYIKTVTNYGVSESTKIKCTECGASNTVLIPFDARTFLPNTR